MALMIKHKMKFRVVMMTPLWAADILARNHPKNRNIKERRVKSYMRAMYTGLWYLTHQGIAIDEEGWLIDGQHRLIAIVRSGVTVPVVLITGVPVASVVAVDTGANRGLHDAAKICGKPLPTPAWGAVARTMMTGLDKAKGSQHIGHEEILRFVRVHSEALTFAFNHLGENIPNLCNTQVRAVVARSFYQRRHRSRIRLFCESLKSGLLEKQKTDMAVIRLRNWLLNVTDSRGKRTRYDVYTKTEWALDRFLNCEDAAGVISTKDELFPIPEEADLVLEEEESPERNGTE